MRTVRDYKAWENDDLRAIRVAEKVRASGIDLRRVRESRQVTTTWLREAYPELDRIEFEVWSEFGIPTDDEVWWGVCNAAFKSDVEVGEPHNGSTEHLLVEARP